MARVLIVEDELLSARVLSTALTRGGHDVRLAARADEAIRVGNDFEPEVLISDWMLKSEQTGADVARELQRVFPNLGVLLITGLGASELREETRGVRVFKILEKPCGLDEVLGAVDDCLASVRAQRGGVA